MDIERLTRETTALCQAAERYRGDLRMVDMWKDAGDLGSINRAVATDRAAQSYALLLRTALDLFEDGDLFDKYRTACQDAGVEDGL